MKVEEVRPAALALPENDRAKLARELIQSLESGSSEQDAEAAWIDEIGSRIRGLDTGSRQPVDWSVARERIKQRLTERRADRA